MAKKKQGGENDVPPVMERLKAQYARPDDRVRGFFFLSRPERLPATEDCLPVPLPTRPTVYPHFEPRPSGIRVPTTNHLLPQLYPDCLPIQARSACTAPCAPGRKPRRRRCGCCAPKSPRRLISWEAKSARAGGTPRLRKPGGACVPTRSAAVS